MNCLAGDAVGDCVYITGPKIGGLFQVAQMDVTDYAKTGFFGIITAKATATTATVQRSGDVVGVTGVMVPGTRYFVGTDAQVTATPPVPGAPANLVVVQIVGIAVDANVLRLSPLLPVVQVT